MPISWAKSIACAGLIAAGSHLPAVEVTFNNQSGRTWLLVGSSKGTFDHSACLDPWDQAAFTLPEEGEFQYTLMDGNKTRALIGVQSDKAVTLCAQTAWLGGKALSSTFHLDHQHATVTILTELLPDSLPDLSPFRRRGLQVEANGAGRNEGQQAVGDQDQGAGPLDILQFLQQQGQQLVALDPAPLAVPRDLMAAFELALPQGQAEGGEDEVASLVLNRRVRPRPEEQANEGGRRVRRRLE